MNSVTGGHAGDLWLRIVLSALVFAACVLGVRAALAGIRSRRSRQLAQLQEEQLLQKMVQFTMRRRLAEILDEGPPPNRMGREKKVERYLIPEPRMRAYRGV